MTDILLLRETIDVLKANQKKAQDAISLMEGTVQRIEALDTENQQGFTVISVKCHNDVQINFQPGEKHYQERIADILAEMMAKRLEAAYRNYETATAVDKPKLDADAVSA